MTLNPPLNPQTSTRILLDAASEPSDSERARMEMLRIRKIFTHEGERDPQLLVQLMASLPSPVTRLVAELCQPLKLRVSRVRFESYRPRLRLAKYEGWYAYACEPTQLADRLAEATQGYAITLLDTY